MRFVAVGVVVLALTGCAAGVSSTNVGGVTVLQQASSSDAQPEALFEGTLSLDSGCLMLVDTEGRPYGLVLPAAATVAEAEGEIVVTIDGTANGIHDSVRWGGGFSGERREDCVFDEYFMPNGVQS